VTISIREDDLGEIEAFSRARGMSRSVSVVRAAEERMRRVNGHYTSSSRLQRSARSKKERPRKILG
jgi:hypothetical protein